MPWCYHNWDIKQVVPSQKGSRHPVSSINDTLTYHLWDPSPQPWLVVWAMSASKKIGKLPKLVNCKNDRPMKSLKMFLHLATCIVSSGGGVHISRLGICLPGNGSGGYHRWRQINHSVCSHNILCCCNSCSQGHVPRFRCTLSSGHDKYAESENAWNDHSIMK